MTRIDWSDAQQYCVWLNEQLGNGSGAIPDLVRSGWHIDLPGELEWEKAARGGLIDRVFSWGDESDVNRANQLEIGIGDTTAVGCFPANDFGLYDMLGNVWEWTRNPWKDTYAKSDFSNEEVGDDVMRVLRGGSWNFYSSFSRCASHGGGQPGSRSNFIGFRLALRSAPV